MENIQNIVSPDNLSQQISTPPIPLIPSKNNYKILFLIFLYLFLVVTSVLITIFVLKNKSTSKNTKSYTSTTVPTIISNNTTKVISSQTIDNTANWKTYSNKDYSFSINYPNEWSIKESISASTDKTGTIILKQISSDSSNIIIISIDSQPNIAPYTNMTFEEFLNKDSGPIENYNSVSSIKKITTKNGTMGYEITYNASDRSDKKYISSPVVYFKINNKTNDYINILIDGKTSLDLFNQIVSTFKFN